MKKINEIFTGSQDKFLDSKKQEFLDGLKESAERKLNEKRELIKDLENRRFEMYSQISKVGNSENLAELKKNSGETFDLGGRLLDIELKLQVAQKELESYQKTYDDLFNNELE